MYGMAKIGGTKVPAAFPVAEGVVSAGKPTAQIFAESAKIYETKGVGSVPLTQAEIAQLGGGGADLYLGQITKSGALPILVIGGLLLLAVMSK
jgi:hypothetical protein